MTRSFYKFGIGCIALLMLLAFSYASEYIQQGESIYDQPWYVYVFWIGAFLEFMAIMIQFKYYKYKAYTLAWRLSFLELARWLFVGIVMYKWIFYRMESPWDYVIYSAGFFVVLLEGLVLVFSRAKERIWLKRLGFMLLIFAPISLTLYLILVTASDPKVWTFTKGAYAWLQLAGPIFPIFYILNYLDELKQLPSEAPAMG